MATKNLAKPFLKWAGGKRQLLEEIRKHLPPGNSYHTYYEPFLGGGAVFFDIAPKKAVLNDVNEELINCYRVVKEDPEALISVLKTHVNESEHFYKIRDLDRNEEIYKKLTPTERAARIIFLNKTCYNGLFRVNSQGQFNAPFGNYANPDIVSEFTLRADSNYIKARDITFMASDFQNVIALAKENDFIYVDPPYHPVSNTGSFTGYTINGFTESDQKRLFTALKEASNRGAKFLASNSSTLFIQKLYNNFSIIEVSASRQINSDSSKRGDIKELLIKNY